MDVYVLNDWGKEHVEMYREQEIRIPANGKIKMAETDAHRFVAQFSPIIRDGMGNDLKPKRLKILPIPEEEGKSDLIRESHKCMACGMEFPKAEELTQHAADLHKTRQLKEPPRATK